MNGSNWTRTVTLRLPDKVFQLLQRPPEEIVQAVRLAAAIHWYERGVLPQDKALEIAGLERRDFLRALAEQAGGTS